MRRRKEYHWVVFDKSIQEPKEILNDIRVIDEIIVSWEDLEGCFDKYFECALENRTEGVIAGAAWEDFNAFLDDIENARLRCSLVELHYLSQEITEEHIKIAAHFDNELLQHRDNIFDKWSFFWPCFHDEF